MKATLEAETQPRSADAAAVTVDDVLPSVRVVEAVAAATDADPVAMDPLYDVIDPDALDQIVASEIEGHVSFEFCGQNVAVHGDGTVVVEGSHEGGD